MMDDRELLEMAAKAYGILDDIYWSHVLQEFVWRDKVQGSEYPEPVIWNPRTDDGDALRLAVALFLDVRPVALDGTANCGSCYETHHYGDVQSIYAATRLAIVRAAAEIGRDMQ